MTSRRTAAPGSLDERGYADAAGRGRGACGCDARGARRVSAAAGRRGAHRRAGDVAPRSLVAAGDRDRAARRDRLVEASGLANATVVNEGARRGPGGRGGAPGARSTELLGAVAADPDDADSALRPRRRVPRRGSTGDDLARAAAALQVLIAPEPDRADAYERLIDAPTCGPATTRTRARPTTRTPDRGRPIRSRSRSSTGSSPSAVRTTRTRRWPRSTAFLELAPDDPRAGMIRGLRDEADATAPSS